MIRFSTEVPTKILTVLLAALLTVCARIPQNRAQAAESKKPVWQLEWEKTLEAAKKSDGLSENVVATIRGVLMAIEE